jgi:hypothetical protein
MVFLCGLPSASHNPFIVNLRIKKLRKFIKNASIFSTPFKLIQRLHGQAGTPGSGNIRKGWVRWGSDLYHLRWLEEDDSGYENEVVDSSANGAVVVGNIDTFQVTDCEVI